MSEPKKFIDSVEVVTPGPIHVVELAGHLDAYAAEPFDERLKALTAAGASKFVLDLTHLNYIGSIGLRVLVGLANRVKGKGAVCVFGPTKDVKDVFEITHLHKVLKFYPSRADALDAARAV